MRSNELRCNVCLAEVASAVERGEARSNVRRFAAERFALWRCPHCKSIHATDEVDLDHYYRAYPFHGSARLSFLDRVIHGNMRRRLVQAGLREHHSVLDYGCGGGALVRYLRSAGHADAVGYDEHAEEHRRPELLERRYDCIVTQDVIEHVVEPWDLLRTFDRLTKPGGLVAIGTPNAEALRLTDNEEHIHGLHQPYHRHIFSKRALLAAGPRLGWSLERYHGTEYVNTLVPFVNVRFVLHLMKCFDNTLDSAFEVETADRRRLLNAGTFWYGFFGYFHAGETGMMAIFRKPEA